MSDMSDPFKKEEEKSESTENSETPKTSLNDKFDDLIKSVEDEVSKKMLESAKEETEKLLERGDLDEFIREKMVPFIEAKITTAKKKG